VRITKEGGGFTRREKDIGGILENMGSRWYGECVYDEGGVMTVHIFSYDVGAMERIL
jgi:hypothetical protein